MELARRQHSGNEHGLIKGIGVVDRLYVNPETGQYWIVDWRIDAPDDDGKIKLDHVREMFDDAMSRKNLPFRAVSMDSWYAAKEVMMHIDRAEKVFYCPLKCNRKADDSGGEHSYKTVDALILSEDEILHGKIVKPQGFPGPKKGKLFRVVASRRTEWVATNDFSHGMSIISN